MSLAARNHTQNFHRQCRSGQRLTIARGHEATAEMVTGLCRLDEVRTPSDGS